MFFLRKDSIIYNFKKYQPTIYRNCLNAVSKAKLKDNTYYLNKASFEKATAKSFDYAILEKTKQINAIKLDIPWSDLGSWKEILKMYDKNKNKYYKKKNVYYRPWGRYVNLFEGKGFLIKELFVKPEGILSLQKHHHRSEHWLVTQGTTKITLNKESFSKKQNDYIFIPLGAVHRIENKSKKPVKIIEAQVGSILKETKPGVAILAVEPYNSAVLSGESPGKHKIQGIGAGFIPDILDTDLYDKVIKVTDDQAFETARLLAKKLGLFVGISTGANVYAAFEVAKSAPIGSEIVESETADKLQSYIESKKDVYGSPYKKEELFGYQYTSSQGGVKVTEYIEPKIKTL